MKTHDDATSMLLPVDDSSQIGAARRAVAGVARALGFDAERTGRAEIVATELATNLLRHATDGRLLLRSEADDAGSRMLEMLAVDAGPGMSDIERCMRDGYSTGGTAGNGLGAVRRLSDDFDISSAPGVGTVVLARLRDAAVPDRRGMRAAGVCLPMPGETVCGDGWAWRAAGSGGSLLVFDGLGHGMLAADAARAACAAFAGAGDCPPADALLVIHRKLSGTRGGAAAIARIDRERGTLQYAGIGNIGGTIVTADGRRGLPSHNGIAGSMPTRVKAFDYDWSDDDVLVMHSDGLQSRWSLDALPGVALRDPAVIAAHLYRDFRRGRDDVTVAVARAGR